MPSAVKPIIQAEDLEKLLKTQSVTLLDATYTPRTDFPTWEQFKKEYYGNFEKLIESFPENAYSEEHIDGAVNFSLDIGMHISQYKRYDIYPEEIFEKYARLLGINCNSHVIVYGRGNGAGMLFAAHVYWLLKYYGLRTVQVLNGGIEAWKAKGFSLSSEHVVPKLGDFKAQINPSLSKSFEQLQLLLQGDGKLDNVNLLDCRPREQYSTEARKLFNLDDSIKGCHVKKAKSLPALELVNNTSGVIPQEEIFKFLKAINFDQSKPTITYCATGNQAALTFLILQDSGISDIAVYQGGMTEFVRRRPKDLL